MKLLNNINTANQLALDIELWVSGPIRIFLQSLSQFIIIKDVEMIEFQAFVRIQNPDDFAAEPALGAGWDAFHEE